MSGQLFDPDETLGMVRNDDIDTAHNAARVALRSSSLNRQVALLALYVAGGDGMTDFELAAQTGIQQTSIGKRRGELRDAGLVERKVVDGKPQSRPSPSRTPAAVWILTELGVVCAELLARHHSLEINPTEG